MPLSKEQLWERFKSYYVEFPTLGLAIDISRMNFADDFWRSLAPRMEQAFHDMAELEKGAIANPDENRMVGHYWLRNPELAPTAAIRDDIEQTVAAIKSFARQVHEGSVTGATGRFKNLLVIGIGGSALGPQYVADALGNSTTDKMTVHFFDNTDPDGMDKVISQIRGELGQTLCLVISKSGGTKETRNGMLETQAAYDSVGLRFQRHAVAVTRANSELDLLAAQQGWLKRFPMWDWIGGRTSELSAVGLLPAALQGIDVEAMLAGAKSCDEITRHRDLMNNPAALLALMIYYSGNGAGNKAMVVLPYKDRLELFSRYLQQLVMESLGKEKDLDGRKVNQGLTVYGNKGSTDQHAYIQQLREGLNNFFVVFIEVLKDRNGPSVMVEKEVTSGDYLSGFLLGTRQALYESDRESVTITIERVSAFTIGTLVALFERTVGFYASLVNINAYHQPGVEAGKKAAEKVMELQLRILRLLGEKKGQPMNAGQIAKCLDTEGEAESVFKICEHLSANLDHGLTKTRSHGSIFDAVYTRD